MTNLPAVSSGRMRRVNESVRAVVADGLRELKDPRIGLVTVTAVSVTPDLREACRGAVHVRTTEGRWLRGGRACLFVLERIGWPRLARVAALPPLVWLVEAGYAVVAHNRALFTRLSPRPRNV